jgi:hypothetical protein
MGLEKVVVGSAVLGIFFAVWLAILIGFGMKIRH